MLHTNHYIKLAAKCISAVALVLCFSEHAWVQPALANEMVDLNIVAHQDDDILFMNPDILNAVRAGHRQVTVFITAGTTIPGLEEAYAREREEGAIAGYSKLLQIADAISAGNFQNQFSETFMVDSRFPAGYPSHNFTCAPYTDELTSPGIATGQRSQLHIGKRNLDIASIGDSADGPRVTLIFLRVNSTVGVDGTPVGYPLASLAQLFTRCKGCPTTIESPFTQDGYTKQELIDQLKEILKFFRPDVVRTQDTARDINGDINVDQPGALTVPDLGGGAPGEDHGVNFYDHSDHVWSARFAEEALRRYDTTRPAYFTYIDYSLEWSQPEAPARLATSNFCFKKSITYHYALHDRYIIFDFCTIDFGNVCPAANAPFNSFFYKYIGYQKPVAKALPK